MKQPLRIGYISVEDANDPRAWSGTHSALVQALREAGQEVVLLGPLRPQPVLFLCQVFNQITWRVLGKRFNYRDSRLLSEAYARILRQRIGQQRFDVLLAPAGLSAIASLKTDVPIVYMNDRCVAGALDYHKVLSDLFVFSREESLALERQAITRSALSVFTSDWAADAAKQAVPEAKERIRTIPMGANLGDVPAPQAHDFPPAKLKLLFVGVNWENKGGPVALDALRAVKSAGVAAELVVCGCTPPDGASDPDLRVEGFLDKSIPEQRQQLEAHFASADVFILPTRFEAYGISFCEAAAYGVPAIGPRTGGVPTIIVDGVTGFAVDPQSDGEVYAERILALVREPDRWRAMRAAARARYEARFTWKAFVRDLLAQVEAAGLISRSR